MRAYLHLLTVMVVASALWGCGGSGALPDNSRLHEAFEQGRAGVWVSGHGTVSQLVGDQTVAGRAHQRFVVDIDGRFNLLVRHAVDQGHRRVPVAVGDVVAFQGRYEWSATGGTLDHTDRDSGQPGQGGWIRHAGTTYD